MFGRKVRREQMYVVHVYHNKVMSESKLRKKVYESKNNQFGNVPFDEWLMECIDRGFISYAN